MAVRVDRIAEDLQWTSKFREAVLGESSFTAIRRMSTSRQSRSAARRPILCRLERYQRCLVGNSRSKSAADPWVIRFIYPERAECPNLLLVRASLTDDTLSLPFQDNAILCLKPGSGCQHIFALFFRAGSLPVLAQREPVLLTLYRLYTSSAPMGRTYFIDDTNGDEVTQELPVYSTQSNQTWNARTSNADCPGCSLRPDPFEFYDHTWHDSVNPNQPDAATRVQFTFKGSAVDIYAVLARAKDPKADRTFPTYISLSVDGNETDAFTWDPWEWPAPAYAYNQKVLSASGLDASLQHMVVVTNYNPNGRDLRTYFMFDYARYAVEGDVEALSTTSGIPGPTPAASIETTTQSTSSRSTTASTPAVTASSSNVTIGFAAGVGIVAGLVVMCLGAFAVCMYGRIRRRNRQRGSEGTMRPTSIESGLYTSSSLPASSIITPSTQTSTTISPYLQATPALGPLIVTNEKPSRQAAMAQNAVPPSDTSPPAYTTAGHRHPSSVGGSTSQSSSHL
ncbi:hypothetical protein BKA62DRAFT_40214 [Auriculariales sp. MPI-PUGE-AT-0066]|nr:hypothetical protein BKA62DRAFT_40214 [Auriculariales sp. MPI-PUGE-AT-0066]